MSFSGDNSTTSGMGPCSFSQKDVFMERTGAKSVSNGTHPEKDIVMVMGRPPGDFLITKICGHLFIPAERVQAGDYKTGSVGLCVYVCVREKCSICYFSVINLWTDFDSVCFVWKRYIWASKFLHWFLPVTFDSLTYNVHFATKCYSFVIFYLIFILFALCDSFMWGLQNFYRNLTFKEEIRGQNCHHFLKKRKIIPTKW